MSDLAFVDIHCHLVPGIDDGATDWTETLAMARMAVADGIDTIICTPHQCGNFAQNRGGQIRAAVVQVQQLLERANIPLRVLPGADVRIESDMISQLRSGEVLSLADRRRHVLLELPHELYLPLEPVLKGLDRIGMSGILSHPERNAGILGRPDVVKPLVERGCLMQLTAGSLVGAFGPQIQRFSEALLQQGLVHFISTDAHSAKSRRPLLRRAFERAGELIGKESALQLCCHNSRAVAEGHRVDGGIVKSKGSLRGWFSRRKAA